MFGSGRTVGIIIIIGGTLFACIGSAVSVVSVRLDPNGTVGGMMLGVGLSVLIAVPIIGLGGYLFWRGRKELAELAQIKRQKLILNMVKTQGQADVQDMVFELKTDTETVKKLIYDLVGKGLFHGYINWDDGILYSKQASALQGMTSCPNCGGEQEFVGQGIVQCRYCGAQIFL